MLNQKRKTMRKISSMFWTLLAFVTMFALTSASSCDSTTIETKTNSGVQKATVEVQTNAQGHTVEQERIAKRVVNDNKPGAIKHLYIISPYSGQTILYSTVDGKVTSSGKRLQPKTVIGDGWRGNTANGDDNWVNIGDKSFLTNEVIQDDGTFGDSDPYIYWWDVRGVYHQHFMTGGQIIHVSDVPMNVKGVIINIESLAKNENQ
jgi:hypothetical protein